MLSRLRLFLALLAALAAVPSAFAQGGVVRLGSIFSDATTFDGDGDTVTLELNGYYASLRLDINGAIGGGSTITVSCSVDGTTYDAIKLSGPAPATTEDADGAVTTTGQYTAGVAACRKVRAVASSWGTGSPTVTLSATASGGASSGAGGSGGTTTDADDASIAEGQTNDNVNSLSMIHNGSAWVRLSAALMGVFAEDSVHSSTQAGLQIFGVRQDAQANFGADGDYVPFSINNAGELRVAFSGAAGGTSLADDADFTAGTTAFTPVGGFYQSTVTACTDGDTCAAGLTAGRAVKVAISNPDGSAASYATDKAEDAAHTDADTGPVPLARRIDTLATSAGSSGDYAVHNQSPEGASYTTPTATAGAGVGCTPHSILSANTVNETAIKASAGNLYHLNVTNIGANEVFFKLYNDTTANIDETDTPVLRYVVPGNAAGAGNSVNISVPIAFSTAITYRITTGAADNNTGAVAADEVLVSACFK